jgi:hypothetical protein
VPNSVMGSLGARFLAVTEQAVLPGMRIDGADADLGVGDAGALHGVVAAPDGSFHQTGLNLVDRIDQADVRGDVDDLDHGRGQHHGRFLKPHEVRQQFPVARVEVPGLVQCDLVQRRGADPLHLTLHPELAGDPDVLAGGVAGLSALSQTHILGCGLGRWTRF